MKLINWVFNFVSKWFSYATAVALSSGVSAIAAIIFGIYYAKAISIPLSEEMVNALSLSAIVAWFAHALQFGVFSKLGFIGFTKSVRTVNTNIVTNKCPKIRANLTTKDYIRLHQALMFLPINNSITAVFWTQVVVVSILLAAHYSIELTPKILIQGIIMDIVFSFIHGGFSLVIAESVTGKMRAICKQEMYEKQIPFINKPLSTVRLKLAFFLILFIITIYVEITLVYYNKDKISLILNFTFLALVVAIFMVYLLFQQIYTSLKDIENSMYDLQKGGKGFLFSKSLDVEFIAVANGINNASKKIKEYQNNLEEKIEARTIALKESLEKVEKLKRQQDGDYFLTSLLLKPLSGNYANNENIKVSMLTKQKKSFEFRNRNLEIGGDLCIAYSIQLKEKNYTTFLNADAMGKSIQGAVGALVLGAVFLSIIERTKFSNKNKNLYPERWLKNTFIELHKTFISFEGSMLVSLVMGLVDEDCGYLYFINAEHPWTVLYSKEKANFLENQLLLRKIGILGVEGQIIVQTYAMKPNDLVIIGSDGRDDILLNYEKGKKLNEDETFFLTCVQKGKGSLPNIKSYIEELGELTDDLSLLSISYQPKCPPFNALKISPEVFQAKEYIQKGDGMEIQPLLENHLLENPKDLYALKILSNYYYNTSRFDKAGNHLLKIAELEPGDEKAIYAASICYKNIGDIKFSIEIAERLRLREPNNEKYISHIANLYILDSNYKRALKIIENFLRFNPDNQKMLNLKEELNGKFSI